MDLRWLLVSLLLVSACDDPPAPEPPAPDPSAEAAASEAPASDTPASDTPAPSGPVAEGAPEPGAEAPAPVQGCTLDTTSDLGLAGWADVVAWRGGFAVALLASEAESESVRLLDASGSQPRVLARATLDLASGSRRTSGPILAADGERLMVAYADGGSRLRVAQLTARPRLTPRTVAEGASLRFRPALTATEQGWAVAWTNAHDTPMRVMSRALRTDGQPSADERDHTPLAGGAAAPAMVAGSDPPRLVFLDPRQATSVCLGAAWAGDGFGQAEVARPVGLVTEPPEVAAVRLGGHDHLAYTGIGNLATTAVGVVALDGTDDPRLLVPGTGYGTLHVDGAPLGAGAVFVADAPIAAPPSSPRAVRLRPVGPDGAIGEPLTIAGPDEHGDRARVAARPDGRVAVVFRSAEHTWLANVRCALPSSSP